MAAEEIAEIVYEKIKTLLLEQFNDLLNYFNTELRLSNIPQTITNNKVTIPKEAKSFKDEHWEFFEEKLKYREKEYYKFARCEHLLELYDEYMKKEPIFVPREFRKDNYFTLNDAEKEVIRNLGIKRLETECQLLDLRRNEFTKRIHTIDKQVKSFINNGQISNEAKSWLQNRWDECTKEDIKRMKEKWSKKIKSTKKRHSQDETFNTTTQSNDESSINLNPLQTKTTSTNTQPKSSSSTSSNDQPPPTQGEGYNQIDSIQIKETQKSQKSDTTTEKDHSKNEHTQKQQRYMLRYSTCQKDT